MSTQGIVKADVLVAPNGTAKSIEIEGGHPLFIQSVQNASREWKWKPAPTKLTRLLSSSSRFDPAVFLVFQLSDTHVCDTTFCDLPAPIRLGSLLFAG